MPAITRDPAGEQASASTELVVVMPVVLTLVLLVVQFGLYLHARQVATAATQEGLAAARLPDGSGLEGRQRARAFIDQVGGLREVTVNSTRTATTARVNIRATAPAVVPGMALGVSAVADGPVERFVAETDR